MVEPRGPLLRKKGEIKEEERGDDGDGADVQNLTPEKRIRRIDRGTKEDDRETPGCDAERDQTIKRVERIFAAPGPNEKAQCEIRDAGYETEIILDVHLSPLYLG